MNYFEINSFKIFDDLYKEDVELFNKFENYEDKINKNVVCIGFDDNFIVKIDEENFNNFIDGIINCKKQQWEKYSLPATFYLWFDEQSLQIRFNILPGINIDLPFGCKIKKVNSHENMVIDALISLRESCLSGADISTDDIQFDQEGEDVQNWTLPVYVEEWE